LRWNEEPAESNAIVISLFYR